MNVFKLLFVYSLLLNCNNKSNLFECSLISEQGEKCIETFLEKSEIDKFTQIDNGYYIERFQDPKFPMIKIDKLRFDRHSDVKFDRYLKNLDAKFIQDAKEIFEFSKNNDNFFQSYPILLHNGKHISIAISHSQYFGGAHPNYFYSCYIYDKLNHKPVSIEKYINNNFLTEIRDLYVKDYCEVNKNYFCDSNNRHEVNKVLFGSEDYLDASVCVLPKGIYIDFGEIFSHSDGRQKLFIPFDQLIELNTEIKKLYDIFR